MGFITEAVGRKRDREANLKIAGANRALKQQQLQFERENLAYQKDLQQQIFEREDNSYQRKAMDLEAAGINPLMAAGGSGASAGSPVTTQAPKTVPTLDYEAKNNPLGAFNGVLSSALGNINMVMSLMKMKNDISTSASQAQMMKEQVRGKEFSNSIHEEFGIPTDQQIPREFLITKGFHTVGRSAAGQIADKYRRFLKPGSAMMMKWLRKPVGTLLGKAGANAIGDAAGIGKAMTANLARFANLSNKSKVARKVFGLLTKIF